MRVISIELSDRLQRTKFLKFPFEIYRDIPQWVPPLSSDAARMLDRRRNPFFRTSKAVFLLSENNAGQVNGRLAILDHHPYTEYYQNRTAFFYLFECINDHETARNLFEAGFSWARQHGLHRIIGPRGFTVLDGLGLLVQGFEYTPALGLPYNPDYYSALIEANGFTPTGDLVSGFLPATIQLPVKIEQAAELVQRHRGFSVLRFKHRRELAKVMPRLRDMYNASLGGTVGNIPMTDEEMNAIAEQMLWFADPSLIKIILKDGNPAGFLFAYPDISAAIQRTRGRFWPFGWIDLLLELHRTRRININGAGIAENHRGLGATALLYREMYHSVVDGGYEVAEIVQIGVENEKMQAEMRNFGVNFCKTHRLYEKHL